MDGTKDKYVVDTAYTWGFYEGQSPVVMAHVARLNGVAAPSVDVPFRYLELGCGNGLTSNILASDFPHAEFHAVDLNAEHIENARLTAEKGGLSNISFHECPFDDLLQRDLPVFDFISCHGVYSWVSESVRQDIVAVIAKLLRPGGLLYLSYNTMPGWAALLPIRQIMLAYTRSMGGSSTDRATQGLKYLRFLREHGAAYFKQNPESESLVDTLLAADRNYVVHEYFNESWEPLYFSSVASDLAGADLKYCGTTSVFKNYLNLCVADQFQSLLQTADDDFVRETHKSLIQNERFRTDVYCRQAEFLPRQDRHRLFNDLICTNTLPQAELKRELRVGVANVSYSGEIFDELIPALEPGNRTVGELCGLESLSRYSPAYVTESVNNLIPSGQFQVMARRAPQVSDELPTEFRIGSALNRSLLKTRLLDEGVCYLGSPVLGSGVRVEVLPGLLLLAIDEAGRKGAVDRAHRILAEAEKVLQIDGESISDQDRVKQLLGKELSALESRTIPILLKFGVIEPLT